MRNVSFYNVFIKPRRRQVNENLKKNLVNAGIIILTIAVAFVMVNLEVVRRAKREYKEGEKFLEFHKNPAKKTEYYNKMLSDKKITQEQYEMLMEDNALKNAYVQYTTVIDLFTPPESKWVKMSRERLKEIEPEYNAWVQSLQKEIDAASGAKKGK